MMLDEPSLGLAPRLVEGLYDLLAQLRDEGVTILLVDQTAVMALSVADRAYVLQSGAIDFAVHSSKDIPALLPGGLTLAAFLPREDPRDALVSAKAKTLGDLPGNARVGTSSPRRQALLKRARLVLYHIVHRPSRVRRQ